MKNKVVGTSMNPKGNYPSPAKLGWPSGRQKAPMTGKPEIPWGSIKPGKVTMPKSKMSAKLKRGLAKGLGKNYSV